MRPSDFARDDATAQGGGWLVGTTVFPENPKRLLGVAEHEMVRVWIACRPGGMGGSRLLPDRGGILDQAAVMLDAIAVMDDEAGRVQRTQTPQPGAAGR
jgi:hypothetical protein